MKTYILYHAKCYDGFGAAWSAWKALGESPNIIYKPVQHSEKLPDLEDGSRVYMLDFCLKTKADLEALANRMESLVVIDHHKTALEAFEVKYEDYKDSVYCYYNGKLDVILDMTKSGALMSWEFFHPHEEAPLMIQYISDRDLWQFKLPQSEEFHAAISMYEFGFKNWDEQVNQRVPELLKEGELLLKKQKKQVSQICENAYFAKIGDHEVPVVNTSVSWSEVGNKLLELYPNALFAASYTDLPGNMRMYSLRSRGDFDVSEVARKFGGGGHKAASGFRVPRL